MPLFGPLQRGGEIHSFLNGNLSPSCEEKVWQLNTCCYHLVIKEAGRNCLFMSRKIYSRGSLSPFSSRAKRTDQLLLGLAYATDVTLNAALSSPWETRNIY